MPIFAPESGMRLLISGWLGCALLAAQSFEVLGDSQGWPTVLRSIGQSEARPGEGKVILLSDGFEVDTKALLARVESGAILILDGHSDLAASLGLTRLAQQVELRQIRDVASPELPIIWERPELVVAPALTQEWSVRATDRWHNSPALAIRKWGAGSVLWTATPLGASGYERYPFAPQALLAAGLEPRLRGQGLWAFFDASFRQRVDLKYLVAQWKQAGIGAIHVTSWQFDGADSTKAAWLQQLIDLCHASLIQVYAWVELPHVSERFWQQYPECREKTATAMDASLDWRRLINLANPRCSALAEADVLALLKRFRWDGVNLGELYFESLEGSENPARFTPFNADVQAEYKALHGRDMFQDLTGQGLPLLLEYRANLAARLQADWLSKLETIRAQNPNFDIVLTHIDDRFDTRMRDALGADAARLLRGTEGLGTGFLIEDPATVWHLGPARYREIRKRYEGLTAEPERLSIDLNIVDRYQDVYPTRRQTGAELAQLVHEAASSFDQVALYFEYSLRPVDLPLLGAAAARVESWHDANGALAIKLSAPARLRWRGPALVNGINWPLTDGEELTLPAGEWRIEPGTDRPDVRVIDSNLRLLGLVADASGYLLHYSTRTEGTLMLETAAGRQTIHVARGKGSLRLSAKQPAGEAVSSSARLLLQR
jgi:hypothetical protein